MMRGSRSNIQVYTDPCPDLVVERRSDNKGVGSWIPNEKHRLLRHYLDGTRYAWKSWPNRVFIDPFSGPGRIQVRGETFTRDGGAVVAWRALAETAPFTHMLVGDIDPERARACEKRLTKIGAPVTAFVGPADRTVDRMVAAVPKGSLCFAFVDPYNLSLLDFSMIQRLASLRKVDLAINFSTMDLKRNADHELDPDRARFDKAAPGWRDQSFAKSANKKTLQLEFFQYWIELVKGLDFKSSKEMPLVSNDSGHEIYRLAFFARHDFPIGLWSDVARDPNESFDFNG